MYPSEPPRACPASSACQSRRGNLHRGSERGAYPPRRSQRVNAASERRDLALPFAVERNPSGKCNRTTAYRGQARSFGEAGRQPATTRTMRPSPERAESSFPPTRNLPTPAGSPAELSFLRRPDTCPSPGRYRVLAAPIGHRRFIAKALVSCCSRLHGCALDGSRPGLRHDAADGDRGQLDVPVGVAGDREVPSIAAGQPTW